MKFTFNRLHLDFVFFRNMRKVVMAHIKKLTSARTGKISYRVHIRTQQKTITKTFKLKKDALSFAQTIEGNSGIKDALTEPLLNQTFQTLIDQYCRIPINDTIYSRLNFFAQSFGQLKLNQIKKSHIRSVLNELAGRGRSAGTVNRYLNDFGSFSKWVNNQLDDTTWKPQRGIERKTEPESRQDYLSHIQQTKLLNHCRIIDAYNISPTTKLYLYVLFALATGARKGEIEALQWRDIQWADKIVIIRAEDTGAGKTGRREIPLSPALIEELNKHRNIATTGLIFPSLEDKTKPYLFRKQWQKARKNAGISDSFVFHSLRHTCASNLAKTGRSLLQIGTILGHRSAQTSLRYSHLVERATLHDILSAATSHLN